MADLNVAKMRPEHWGAAGNGVADDTTAVQAFCTCVQSRTRPSKAVFTPGAEYLLSSTINFQMADDTTVEAEGTYFLFSNNGVGFDLNPAFTAVMPVNDSADTYTIRNVLWRGGTFDNNNATKTASVAIQAYYFRKINFENLRIGGTNVFYAGIKFDGKDTYRFVDCYVYGGTRQYWVPPEDTVYLKANTGNNLTSVEWQNCVMVVTGTEAGIYVENTFHNMRIVGGNFAGACTVACAKFISGTVNPSTALSFSGAHFEQMPTNLPAVLFEGSGGSLKGFDIISFDDANWFYSANSRWGGVKLDGCRGVKFGSNLFWNGGGSAKAPMYGIYVDDNSTLITVDSIACEFKYYYGYAGNQIAGTADNGSGLIRMETTVAHLLATGDRVFLYNVGGTVEANGMWVVTYVDTTHFDLQGSTYSGSWTSGGAYQLLNPVAVQSTADRANISVVPETINLTLPITLTGFNLDTWATASAILNMGNILGSQSLLYGGLILFESHNPIKTFLWPKGYEMHLTIQDSGSAAATNCNAKLYNPAGSGTYGALRVDLDGVTNNQNRSASGHVPADTSGNVKLDNNDSGFSTMKVAIGVSAIRQ